jgi:hypothetical protein
MTDPKDVAAIVAAVGKAFSTFGGGRYTPGNPVSLALANQPLTFAAGVPVAEVVTFVIAQLERKPEPPHDGDEKGGRFL